MSLINGFKDLINGTVGHRSAQRFSLGLSVSYFLLDGDPQVRTALLNKTKNISKSGICLLIYERLEKETRISLNLTLSPEESISINGEVMWQTGFKESDNRVRYETGISFDSENKEQLSELDAFLKKMPRQRKAEII